MYFHKMEDNPFDEKQLLLSKRADVLKNSLDYVNHIPIIENLFQGFYKGFSTQKQVIYQVLHRIIHIIHMVFGHEAQTCG